MALRDWLAAFGVTHVAMEATGVYWQPVWHILEDDFELTLCNARHVKQAPAARPRSPMRDGCASHPRRCLTRQTAPISRQPRDKPMVRSSPAVRHRTSAGWHSSVRFDSATNGLPVVAQNSRRHCVQRLPPAWFSCPHMGHTQAALVSTVPAFTRSSYRSCAASAFAFSSALSASSARS